jgi:hypothetical protein
MDFRVRIAGVVAIAAALVSLAGAQTPAAPPADQSPLGPSGQIQARFAPPARINKFTAEPGSLQPGQSFLLVWAAENPTTITITPGIGTVTARGTRKLTPKATTTYTITVHGMKDSVATKSITVTVAGTVPLAASADAAAAQNDVPRLPDGKPDLSGVYNMAPRATDTPPELKPGAEKFKVVRGPKDAGLYADCMPTGVPQTYFVPYQWQIVQSRDKVVILHEYLHLFRVIPTDGTPHPADPDPTWMGDSVGVWEGDTLVVDTIAFNDKTELPGGFRHTEALHVVERFHRLDFDHLRWDATIEDPNVFAKPWTISRTFPLRGDLEKVDEYVCENNRDYKDLFGK